MTFRTRAEFEAEGGRLVPPFVSLIAGEMSVADLVSAHRLTPSDISKLKIMVDHGLAHWARGRDRLRFEPALKRKTAPKLDDRKKAKLQRAIEHFFGHDMCVSITVQRCDLGMRGRRDLVWVVRDTARRFEVAKLALRNADLVGRKRSLPNTFRLDPKKIEDPAERRRLARNDNYVRHLSGRRGMRGGTLIVNYRLTMSEAIQIRDSANAWRRSCEKAQ